jgi:hypothetical protein
MKTILDAMGIHIGILAGRNPGEIAVDIYHNPALSSEVVQQIIATLESADTIPLTDKIVVNLYKVE